MMNHAQSNPAPIQPKRQRGRWFWRLVRLLFADAYKRGFAAGRAVVQWRDRETIRVLRSDMRTTEECYRANLAELREETSRREIAEQKLRECRRCLRAANKGAERNALVAQLCAARLANRAALPNTKTCHGPEAKP